MPGRFPTPARLLVVAVLLSGNAVAQEAPAPRAAPAPSTEIPAELDHAVSETRRATRQFRVDQKSQSADELVNKTEDLVKQLGPSTTSLPRDATDIKRNLGRIASDADSLVDVVERSYAPSRAIVVSGGVSMGSYQAGFLYYYSRALRFFSKRLPGGTEGNGRFQIATGASAGSINSFLAAIDGCLEPQLDPEQSLFFKTWSGIGLKELIPLDPAPSADGLFAEKAFTQDGGPINLLDQLWADGKKWPAIPCETALGITATRLAPRRVKVFAEQIRTTNGGTDDGAHRVLTLDRMTEKFLLTMSGGGDGKAPKFTTRRVDGASDDIYPTLGEAPAAHGPNDLPVSSKQVLNLLRASSAFPVAFSPKVVPVTTWYGSGPNAPRSYDPNALFTDGGFLDNAPLRIAQKLSKPAAASREGSTDTPRPRVLLLMSNAQSWKKSQEQLTDASQKSVLGRYLPFVFNFLSTASDGALIDVFEDDNGKFTYDIPMRPFPIAADPLGHFFAFAEPSFRRFDFYQGMLDAEELIYGRVQPGRSLVPFSNDAVLECFRSYRRQAREANLTVPSPGPSCNGIDAHLTALLQASAYRRANVQPDDDDLEKFTEALYEYDFKYQELAPNQKLTPTGVALALRATFDRLGGPFASAQPDPTSELGVAAIAPVATDLWRYRARTYFAIGVPGDANLQLTLSVPLWRWRSWSLRFQVGGFIGLYPKKTSFMTDMGPLDQWRYPVQIGPGLAAEYVASKAIQLELGAGYAPRTEFFVGDGTPYVLHGIEGHLSVVFGERIFLSLSPAYFFGDCAGNNRCDAINAKYASYAPAIVPQSTFFLVPDDMTFRLSAGWRFLW
jgi:hypothetical protein